MATLVYKSFCVAAEGFLSLFESSRSNREDVSNRLKVSMTVDRYWLIQADTHLFSTKLSHAVSIFQVYSSHYNL